jgi:hypothetical protein
MNKIKKRIINKYYNKNLNIIMELTNKKGYIFVGIFFNKTFITKCINLFDIRLK